MFVIFDVLGEGDGGRTYNSVQPRGDVALSIAVAGAVGGASGVEIRLAALGLHLAHVEGAVHTAGQLGSIDVEGEFLVGQLDHLVLLLVGSEEVDSGAGHSVLAVHVEGDGPALGGHTVVGVVVDALEDAVLRAGGLVRAGGGVGTFAPVAAALGGVVLLVDPVGGGVKDEGRLLGFAATLLGALPCCELGVDLGGGLADGLGSRETQEDRDDKRVGSHYMGAEGHERGNRYCVMVDMWEGSSPNLYSLLWPRLGPVER